jgi:hypothetical protein
MSTYPGSGPCTPKVKPLLPALLFIFSTRWLTRLLELCCLEVEEEVFNLPTLRVQAPLYRQGPGYSLVSGCLAADSSVVAVLTWAPLSSGPLSGRRPLYKAPFPLGPAYSEHMPPVCLGSFRGGGACPLRLVRLSMASVTLVSGHRRSCRGHAAFDKASAGGFSSSSPARTSGDEVASRLLAQPALRVKSASPAECRSDHWDVSRQMAPPLAYPDSHPHDNQHLQNQMHIIGKYIS